MRRPLVLAFPLCLAGASSCGDPLAPLPAGVPQALTYVVEGGLAGVVIDLRLAGDTVVLVSRVPGPQGWTTATVRRVPSDAEWQDFSRAAGRAGVRRWPRRCTDDLVADAGGFSYTLAWSGAQFAGSYYAKSPTAGGGCSDVDRADAQAFGLAVLALAGNYSAQ